MLHSPITYIYDCESVWVCIPHVCITNLIVIPVYIGGFCVVLADACHMCIDRFPAAELSCVVFTISAG